MPDISEPGRLADYAEEVVREIRSHAILLETDNRPDKVIPAINSLRAAALRYVDSVLAQTGWGNVFADLGDDEGDGPSGTPKPNSPDAVSRKEVPVVTYQVQYKLRIHDFNQARRLLEERSRLRSKPHCEDYDDSFTGLVAGLAEIDGWQPYSYDQRVVEVVEHKWASDLDVT